MAISTYAELQTALGNWTDRTDLALRFPEYIALFEAHVNRRLRVRPQHTTSTITISSGSGTLPTDYLEWKRVTWQGTPTRELDYVTPSYLAAVNSSSVSANPLYFTIEGETIKVAPLSNTSLVMLYAQKVPALTSTNTTNWLLTAHPDAYLYGSLVNLAAATSDMEQGLAWNAMAEKALGEVWSLDFATRGTMIQRQLGPNP